MIDHVFILTRLGCWPTTPEWRETRLPIFETACRESILGQTHKNWTWLLLSCDQEKERVEKYADHPQIEHISAKTDEETMRAHGNYGVPELPYSLIRAVSDRIGNDNTITLRVDSDDVIHPEFIDAALFHLSQKNGHQALWFPNGAMIRWDNKRVARRKYDENHFITYFSPEGSDNHVFCWPHDRFLAPKRFVDTEHPMWFQIAGIHNVSSHRWIDSVFSGESRPLNDCPYWPWGWQP